MPSKRNRTGYNNHKIDKNVVMEFLQQGVPTDKIKIINLENLIIISSGIFEEDGKIKFYIPETDMYDFVTYDEYIQEVIKIFNKGGGIRIIIASDTTLKVSLYFQKSRGNSYLMHKYQDNKPLKEDTTCVINDEFQNSLETTEPICDDHNTNQVLNKRNTKKVILIGGVIITIPIIVGLFIKLRN